MTKAKRRQYDTGSLYQRSRDGRWVGTIEAGYTRTGGRRRITVTGRSEAECKRRLRDKKMELDRDGQDPAAPARTTVKQWADTWLEIQRTKKRPGTWQDYNSLMRNWVVPTIGHKRLDTLTPGDIRAVANAHRAAGHVSTTALKTHNVLHKMLQDATVEGHRVPYHVLAVEGPAVAANDREALTTSEAIAVLEVASTLTDGSRWVAALLQGMRQGECLGLTWDAVHLDAGFLEVSWQLQTLTYADRDKWTFLYPDGFEYRHLEGAWHLVRPKTKKSWRVIPLVPWMTTALRAWQQVAPVSRHGLVWPRLNGQPAVAKDDTEEWQGLQGVAGVGHPEGRYYVLHEARNTTATLLMEAGVNDEVITAILGHSSIVTSRSYMHVRQAPAMQAMEQVAARLELTAGS